MYLDFYKLTAKPFQISTDPRFLWLGEKHREALAVLKYGILDNKGFLLLTGDVGTGKTTLLNALIDSLGDNVLVALVTDPGLAKMDFFNFVADSFEMHKSFRSKGDFLIYLKNYLLELNRQNRQALLIIDECQHLNQKLLEEVRLLSNIEKYNAKLINIFFVGQSEFNEIILRPRNRAIRQRITINYNIASLSASETEDYIRFRLKVAGSSEPIFSPKAIREVFKFSNGYPRLINIICDQALLTGYVKEKNRIDEKMVAECAEELKISHDLPISKSRATPETIAPAPVASGSPKAAPGPQPPRDSMTLKRPLVIALIVVLIIWSGLVIAYFINQNRPLTSAGPANLGDRQVQSGTERVATAAAPTADGDRQASSSRPSGTETTAAMTSAPASPAPEPAGSATAALQNEPVPAPPVPREKQDKVGAAETVTLAMINDKYGMSPEIYFGFNSNNFNDEAYPLLNMIARYCLQNPGVELVLRGYSDKSGVRAYNLKLSEFRADMVKTYLVGRGVPDDAVQTIAIGPDPGAGSGAANAEGSQRKVVVEIIPLGN